MKTLYTILFFLDTLALILLTYNFLEMSDQGRDQLVLTSLFGGILFCIILLIHVMIRYTKLPNPGMPD